MNRRAKRREPQCNQMQPLYQGIYTWASLALAYVETYPDTVTGTVGFGNEP